MSHLFEHGRITKFDPSKGRGLIRFDGSRKVHFLREDVKDAEIQSLLQTETEEDHDILVCFALKQTGMTYWAEQIALLRDPHVGSTSDSTKQFEGNPAKQQWRTALGSAISSFLSEGGDFPESKKSLEDNHEPALTEDGETDSSEEIWESAVGSIISQVLEDPKVCLEAGRAAAPPAPALVDKSTGAREMDSNETATSVGIPTPFSSLGVLRELPTTTNEGTVEIVDTLERDMKTGLLSIGSVSLPVPVVGKVLCVPATAILGKNLRPGSLVHLRANCSMDSARQWSFQLADPDLERIGYEIRLMPENFWTKSSRVIDSEDPFAEYYLQVSESLVGPWGLVPRGESFELVPVSPDGLVWEHLVENIRHTAIVEVDNKEYVLPLDPQRAIRYLDSKVANELTDWFIEQLSSRLLAVFAHLETEHPSWRSEFGSVVLDYGDPNTRQIYQQRWEKAEHILDAFVTQYHKFEELVNSNNTLQDLLRMNVQHRLEELESQAFEQAEREAQLCLEREREELRQLRKDIAQAKRDLGSVQSASLKPPAQKLANVALGDVGDQRNFCERVLGPNLSRWVHNQTDQYVETLHLAALCTRNILVPDFAWSRGFYDAFVPDQVVYEQFAATPAWIAPRDLWDAGLSDIWNQSLANPKKLFIGHIADINSSFVQYWALPYLLAGTGVSSRLAGMSDSGWPENLRLFWSPIEENSIFRLPEHLKRAFSAACPFSIPADHAITRTEPDSSLEVEKWLKWLPDKTSDGDFRSVGIEGPFARPVADEIHTLRGLARDFTRDDTTADIYSRNIRIEWVNEYFQIGSTGVAKNP